jgi:hypothetical protein
LSCACFTASAAAVLVVQRERRRWLTVRAANLAASAGMRFGQGHRRVLVRAERKASALQTIESIKNNASAATLDDQTD